MDYIKFSSTYKADGKQYERIVFWNRFLRNKTELIISLAPALASIVAIALGYRTTFLMIIYFVCVMYPFLAYRQFKSSVKYHLEHRDKIESAPCEFTLMNSGILCEFADYEEKKLFKWEEFTTVYDKLGYYMFFSKGTMHVMLNKADIPDVLNTAVYDYINNHINHNLCIIKK